MSHIFLPKYLFAFLSFRRCPVFSLQASLLGRLDLRKLLTLLAVQLTSLRCLLLERHFARPLQNATGLTPRPSILAILLVKTPESLCMKRGLTAQ